MQELSVTGATLVDYQTKTRHQHSSSSSHSHDHNHHQHEQPCCHKNVVYQLPTIQLKKPAQELVAEYDDSKMLTTVNQIVRLGSFDLFQEVVSAWQSARPTTCLKVLHSYDPSGHTLTHWAAKRIDCPRFIEYFLYEIPFQNETASSTLAANDTTPEGQRMYESPLHRPTMDETKMTPVHWVCTIGGNIALLQIMLQYIASRPSTVTSSILELRDGTACTPVLIAAQHGLVDTCAFLIQKGADHRAVDSSRDTATHWAAYKGSELVLGLLSFYDTAPLLQPDSYGQTPMHLAALRGHVGTVRYILQQLRAMDATTTTTTTTTHHSRTSHVVKDVLTMKDTNGRTPYELAVHKQQHAVAELLHQTMHPNFRQYLSIRTCKSWLGLMDADESPKLPYYYVWLHIVAHVFFLFGVFLPIFNTGEGILWDHLGLHMVQLIGVVLIVYSLYKTTTTNPGRLDKSHLAYQEYRKLYEIAISGDNMHSNTGELQLCHSCHIARPLRSKHCRITGTCILAFDHHCPFVAATVGLYNYTWFYSFLLLLTIYLINFSILLFMYYQRMTHTSHNTTIVIVGVILALHIFFPGGMLVYHTQLTGLNLTTNEHMNLYKYKYLRPNRPFSPWDRGVLSNFMDRILSPDERSYELPNSAIQGLLDQQRDGQV